MSIGKNVLSILVGSLVIELVADIELTHTRTETEPLVKLSCCLYKKVFQFCLVNAEFRFFGAHVDDILQMPICYLDIYVKKNFILVACVNNSRMSTWPDRQLHFLSVCKQDVGR